MSLRVLVVENDPDTSQSYGLLLRHWGHHARLALTGEDGLHVAGDFLPNVVLLDMGLGKGLDGYQVARSMRADVLLAGVVLVAVTGYGGAADKEAALAAGCDYHFVKPVAPDELCGFLRSLDQGAALTTAVGGVAG
ncbi:MAG TPA: response regulator [Gemmataceae bacterium]|nr:response regulator [Gemmataceae bacterium]